MPLKKRRVCLFVSIKNQLERRGGVGQGREGRKLLWEDSLLSKLSTSFVHPFSSSIVYCYIQIRPTRSQSTLPSLPPPLQCIVLPSLPASPIHHLLVHPATYFAATKLCWMLEHVPEVKKAHDEKNMLFGTVDSWLLYVSDEHRLRFVVPW